MTRDFASELRRVADERDREVLPRGSLDRLLQKSGGRPWRFRFVVGALVTATAAAVAIFFLMPRSAGGFELERSGYNFSWTELAHNHLLTRGDGVLRVPELATTLEVSGEETELQRDRAELRLVRGKMRVRVRQTGEPKLRVRVSHGTIHVAGTCFRINQRQRGGGRVAVEEGKVRFESLAGRTVTLSAGDELSWPLDDEPSIDEPSIDEPVVQDDALPDEYKRKTKRRLQPLDAEALAAALEELERLRLHQRYDALASAIARLLPRVGDRSLAESLSFELGDLLSEKLGNSARACRHWRGHRRRFGGGRYGERVQRAEQQLGCQ